MSDNSWISFWNSQHSIYVNARHLDLHYRDVADRLLQLQPDRTARVLDFGCGEATHADRVAAAVDHLWLCEAASRVREHLRARFGAVTNLTVIGPDFRDEARMIVFQRVHLRKIAVVYKQHTCCRTKCDSKTQEEDENQ